MPYTRNTWVNNTTPAISAVNLNRLTDELEQQAFARSVSHTLPTWADGVVPAVSDPVPLNEMERVLQVVAASLNLPAYTKTTWQAGWVPARNAANLNKMELQAVANRNAIETTPPAESPLGLIKYGGTNWGVSNLDKYGHALQRGPAPGAFTGINWRYQEAVVCQDGGENTVSLSVAQANNWLLRDTNGQFMENLAYGGFCADVGLQGYQQYWCEQALLRVQADGADGIWADNAAPRIMSIATGGTARPVNYPTDASYETALLSWSQYVHSFCNANGFKCAYNAGVTQDNTGSLSHAWFLRQGQYAHYLTREAWLVRFGATVPRLVGPEYWNNWDGYRSLHSACISAGCGFLPISTHIAQVYTLATFLLDWQGKGANLWQLAENYQSTTDHWIPQYQIVSTMGNAQGAATKAGDVWTRVFANATVTVNPVAGTASIVAS